MSGNTSELATPLRWKTLLAAPAIARATPPLISGSNPLDAVYRSVAAASSRKVTFSAAPERALASNDRAGRLVFRPTLPCLPGERQRSECVDGQILVRSADRMHLCAAFGAGVVVFIGGWGLTRLTDSDGVDIDADLA